MPKKTYRRGPHYPTSLRLDPKVRQGLEIIAAQRAWTVSKTIKIACEELIARYIYNRRPQRRKRIDQPPPLPADFEPLK